MTMLVKPFLWRSKFLIEVGRNPTAKVVAGCVLALYITYHITKFQISGVPIEPRGDASILFSQSQIIFKQVGYPENGIFPYSPSAVLIFYFLGAGGPSVFAIVWYTFMIAGMVLVMRASAVQERQDVQAAWLLVGVAAILLTSSPISWDLRNANSNLVYLSLVMAGYGLLGCLPILAGTLVGLSISLKLYSGLLLLWLLITGSTRAAVSAITTIFFLWILLPAVLFGTDGAATLYEGWARQLQLVSDPSVHMRLATMNGGPPLVTLRRAIVSMTGEPYQSVATLSLLALLWCIWIAALLWYVWRASRSWQRLKAPSRAALSDWIVLLLAPLPFSPWLEPYHFVPLFVAAILFLFITLSEIVTREDRLAALVPLAVMLSFVVIKIPFDIRGLGLSTLLLICVLTLGCLRPRARGKTAQQEEV